jgi:hypothetical protein
MRTASIQEIKEELSTAKPSELTALCLRLARFKKDNKELLTYLLFEAHDEEGYIRNIKMEVDAQFATINFSQLYYVKKSLRKILRIINKQVRYMGSKQAEVELLLYFCTLVKESGIPIERNTVIRNLYYNQLKKLHVGILSMHEDLQYDYLKQMKELSE